MTSENKIKIKNLGHPEYEASLKVPDFTISVNGSSCSSLIFCLILFAIYFMASHPALGMQILYIERESKGARTGPKK